jgi:hypothetical protein
MKRIVFILGVLLIPVFGYSQTDQEALAKKQQKELIKEKRKAEKKAAEDSVKQVVAYMLENRSFVLEADYIAGRSGSRIPVSSNLNFIIVDSANAVIQLGSNNGLGANGVGGITVDGSVSRYELAKNENKKGISYTVTLFVNSVLGVYDIILWVSQEGYTTATIRGTTSGSLSYSGNLVPIETSRVYKGHAYP